MNVERYIILQFMVIFRVFSRPHRQNRYSLVDLVDYMSRAGLFLR